MLLHVLSWIGYITIPLLLEVPIPYEHAQELVLWYQPLAGRIKAASFLPCEQILGLFQCFIASSLKPVIVKLFDPLLFFVPQIFILDKQQKYMQLDMKMSNSILGHFIRVFIFCLLSPIVKTELERYRMLFVIYCTYL